MLAFSSLHRWAQVQPHSAVSTAADCLVVLCIPPRGERGYVPTLFTQSGCEIHHLNLVETVNEYNTQPLH